MKITMLGTGNALTTEYYNTCFIISDNEKHFLVDGGGGNGILRQFKKSGFSFSDIHDVFVTHTHTDHLLGIIWVIRKFCNVMNNENDHAYIYAHDEVINILRYFSEHLPRLAVPVKVLPYTLYRNISADMDFPQLCLLLSQHKLIPWLFKFLGIFGF